ncbi:hypothetical protein [Lactiplantibacillus plantarum]|uniref:hypothetical protein n=1 Tax=Lactiplantibacillus plantarum TaxID=1590 RepID=UPI00084F86C2|nr:hypothetical protein [Lactiplantibacillus plantarum]AUV72203.1 hypothetical protein C1940_06880 [Lactiplantibacillus plantarum subsp. plantarum]QLQ49188.1 hypothetical protein H0E85_10770 [Lactiplantibacillus plantarum]RWZ44907.1 hypothetical protein EQG58_10455 [Lactiplantibacillus plantarum]WDQ19892.1 hypothetical protein PTW40_09080 [Lactiplantibacillus plantarum]BEI53992.1 hypothetical protein AWA2045_21230 [Lactiplantibacillus plantarum]
MNSDTDLHIQDVNDILTALPTVNEDATYWMVRANKGEYYSDFVISQYVGIGYDEISLKEARDKTNDELTNIFHDRKPLDENGNPIPSGTYTSWIGQLKRFSSEIKTGDYILVPSDGSDHFSLGIVIGEPFELSDTQLTKLNDITIEGRKKSPYKKRIKVQFMRSFTRSEADPALYKMIYTQTTVSKITKYAPFILRAAFDAYVSGEKVYLTFPVNKKEDINARPYTSFLYHLTESYVAISPDSDPVIKSNVQSAGVVQLVLELGMATGIFGLIWVCLRSKVGFTIDVKLREGKFKFKKEDSGIVAQRISKEKSEQAIAEQRAHDEHLQKMIQLANESNVPMDKIQAAVSSELENAVKKAAIPNDKSAEDNQE